MKKELADQKKKEVDRYLQLLKQEDSRYEFESSNVAKIENEIIKMYKKGKWWVICVIRFNNIIVDYKCFLLVFK